MAIIDNKPVRRIRSAGVPGAVSPSYTVRPRNAMLLSSGNKCIAVVMDPNDSAAPAGSGDATNVTKIYVYESTDRGVWTLINTVTPTNGLDKSSTYDPMYACAIGQSNQIFIIYRATGGSLRSLILSTTTYTIAEDKLVAAAVTGGSWTALDLDFTTAPTGGVSTALAIAAYVKTATANDHIGYSIFHRRSSDAQWLTEKTQATDPGNRVSREVNMASMVAIKILNGSVSNATLRFAYAFNVMDSTTDQGFGLQTATVDSDNGGMTAVATIFGYGATKNTTCRTDVPVAQTQAYEKHRQLDIFVVNDSGDFIIANTQFLSTTQIVMYGASYNFSGAQVFAPTSRLVNGSGVYPATWSNGVLVFHFGSGGLVYAQINWNGSWGGVYNWTNGSAQPVVVSGNQYYHATGSTGWNTRINQDLLALVPVVASNTPQYWYAYPLYLLAGPVSITPLPAATVATSVPPLTANADLNTKYPQSRHKVIWQLAVTPDFATMQRNFTQNDTKLALVTGTEVDGVTVQFSDTLPIAQALSQANAPPGPATWYIRAALIDEYGKQHAWSASQTFQVSHPPSATPVAPSGVTIYGTGVVTFNWTTSDPYVNDYQTAYQIIVENNADNSVVYDSGKITSTAKILLSAPLAVGNKDLQLRWKVRVWDMDDVPGAYSSTLLFKIEDPPTVAISAPAGGTPVATPFVTTTFTPTVAGGRTITKYSIVVTQGSTTVFDTGGYVNNTPPTATGVPITYTSGASVYKNDQQYTMTLRVQDSDGLEATSAVSFSTHWTPPAPAAGVAVDTTQYNVEGAGYVRVTWNDTARDPAFVNWIVYRKSDEINLTTLAVIKAGTWEPLASVYIPATTYIYDDYRTPAAHKVSYYVSQVVNRFGDFIESETITPVVVYPHSDGYWVLMETGSVRLSIVTGDSYTDEYEEETLNIYGRGRYVDRGSYLGIVGSLDVQLRDTGGTSARMKKQQLEAMKAESQNTYLRTPFGDIYKVSVGNLGIGRIAGVGEAEFCDVSIPYSQVAE